MNKTKLMSKTEPEAWSHGTDRQWPEGRGGVGTGGTKGKGLVKEHM